MKKSILFSGLALIGMLGFVGKSPASIFHVDANSTNPVAPFTSWNTAAANIQSAIDAATNGDTVLVTNGTYDVGGATVSNMPTRVAITKAISVESVNGADYTFIVGAGSTNGPSAMRCAYLADGAKLTGFTLTGGHTHDSSDKPYEYGGGGAFLVEGAVIENCIVTSNSACEGGGVNCWYGGAVKNCTINGNSTSRFSAGVDFNGGGWVENCIITSNSAAFFGGGIGFGAGGTAVNCTISSNSANNGGGVFISLRGTLINCTIASNSVNSIGGGVLCSAGGTLNNCTIVSNSANDNGGGVYCGGGATLDNCTIAANSANGIGGGVYCSGDATLNNCISWDNTDAGDGNWTGTGSWTNCCTLPSVGVNCITTDPLFVSSSNYYIQATSPCINAGTNLPWMVGAIDPDGYPRIMGETVDIGAYELLSFFVDITNDTASVFDTTTYTIGGRTYDCIGDLWWTNAANGAHGTLPVSGFTFQVSGIPLAYSVNSITVYGTNNVGSMASDNVTIFRHAPEDSGNSLVHHVSTNGASIWPYTNWTTAASTIQLAIDAAAAGDTVLVDDGTYGIGGAVVGNMLNRVALTKGIRVESVNGPEHTLIVGEGPLGPSAMRCTYLIDGAELIGFSLADGHTHIFGDELWEYSGGGAFFDGGGTLSNCTISGNSADLGGGAYCYSGGMIDTCTIANNSADLGGGAYCYSGGWVENCIITSNSATYGGGAYCCSGGMIDTCTIANNSATYGGGAYCYSGGMLDTCTIANNSATSGGGVRCDYGGTLNGCSISNNMATYGGGAFYYNGGMLDNCTISSNSANRGGGTYCIQSGILNNCTVSGNSATDYGGGTYCSNGGTLNNCIVWDNSANFGNNWYNSSTGMTYSYCCTTPGPDGTGNITNTPLLAASNDYHLQSNSPCINAGHNDYILTDADLDGNPRIVGGVVDMGAYERQDAGTDADADGMEDVWEMTYLMGRHFSDPDAICANSTNTLLEAYIAGFDPTDPDAGFPIDLSKNAGSLIIEWLAVSGRVYNIHWTPSLLEPFQPLEIGLPYPQNSYTDTLYSAESEGYYKVDVRMQ